MKKITHYMLIIVLLSSSIGFAMEVETQQKHFEALPAELLQYIAGYMTSAETIQEAYRNILSFLLTKKDYSEDKVILKDLVNLMYQQFIISINQENRPEQRAANFKTVLAGKTPKVKHEYAKAALFLALSLKNNDYALQLFTDLISSFSEPETFNFLIDSIYRINKERREKYFKTLKEIINEEIINNIHTPLQWAIYHDDEQAIDSLIEDAKVNKANAVSIAPLMVAVLTGNFNIVKYLVGHGANVDTYNNNRVSALMYAVNRGDFNIVQYLVENSVNIVDIINMRDNNGATALMYAVNRDIVNYLIEQGADINAQDKYGRTALMYALKKRRLDIVKFLVDKGAVVDIQDKSGGTVLMYAIIKGRVDIVNDLVARSAQLDMKNNKGLTALMYAVDKGHLDIVKFLIDKGAVVDHVLVQLAKNKKHTDIEQFLEQKIMEKKGEEPAAKRQKIE